MMITDDHLYRLETSKRQEEQHQQVGRRRRRRYWKSKKLLDALSPPPASSSSTLISPMSSLSSISPSSTVSSSPPPISLLSLSISPWLSSSRRNLLPRCVVVSILLFSAQQPCCHAFTSSFSSSSPSAAVYQYNICNGLSNQLLYHSASIAIAIEQKKEVHIPNHFIVNGMQTTDESVLPTPQNSIPLNVVFDSVQLLHAIETIGGIRAKLVNSFEHNQYPPARGARRPIPCAGMQSLHQADPRVTLQILQAFQPSITVRNIAETINEGLQDKNRGGGTGAVASSATATGMCVHHRDGTDWYDHCKRWGNIRDGIYRGNCLGVPGRSFLESLQDRGGDANWIYYCGDQKTLPAELKHSNYNVYTKHDFLTYTDLMKISNMVKQAALDPVSLGGAGAPAVALTANGGKDKQQQRQEQESVQNKNKNNKDVLVMEVSEMRDLWALIDFTVCRGIETFVGNSVSTFSAIQIALRDGDHAYWYNSQSIPLGDIWHVYQIPIVYTYTELSQESGKHLLQASIASVREHMPNNKIHIIYHGTKDAVFRTWLAKRNVIIHQHDPVWAPQIEEMRKNGNPARSHLFLHAGNYLGTWQRIDIPLMIHQEYVLLLDADTVIHRPFTLADFGLDLTYGIAMSSEFQMNQRPVNAGVMVMNIPYMRQTYNAFLEFILDHVETAVFNNPAPSDQGAYLEFYESHARFLARSFNFKPYYNTNFDVNWEEPYIIHFHGAKPHDYLKHILGDSCDQAVQGLCSKVARMPSICLAFQLFAKSTKAVDPVGYCNDFFHSNANEALFCNDILDALVKRKDTCTDLPYIIRDVLAHEPADLDLPKETILINLSRGWGVWEIVGIIVVAVLVLACLLIRLCGGIHTCWSNSIVFVRLRLAAIYSKRHQHVK